jgi:hypothetical protein
MVVLRVHAEGADFLGLLIGRVGYREATEASAEARDAAHTRSPRWAY